jgi:hypothetical protein
MPAAPANEVWAAIWEEGVWAEGVWASSEDPQEPVDPEETEGMYSGTTVGIYLGLGG